jgi:choline-sulfatase
VTPPNILLIMVDQMTAGFIGALGHPAAITPNLDGLVANGVSFENAYCNSPICVPARASFMTGNLPHRTGVFDNGTELPASTPTLAHHLSRAGYNTILAGKMHFVGPDQLHGFNERLTGDISLSGLTLTPDWRRGAYPNQGSSVRRLQPDPVVDWNLQLAYDEEVLSSSLARLRKLREEGDRFFLCASFSHPHDPFRTTREYWDRYEGALIPPPAAPPLPLEEMHPYNRWIQIHHEVDRHPPSEREVRAARRAYLAMVSYADDLVGKLLRELDRLGLDDTLVVFTSDHGEMLGEHGMWFKRTFFDAAAKVPLIVRWPERLAAGSRSEVVSLIDLTAALLDIADVPGKEQWIGAMDGDSLLPLLLPPPGDAVAGPGWDRGANPSPNPRVNLSPNPGVTPSVNPGSIPSRGRPAWKDSAICEYFAEGTVEPLLLLRKGRWKYVHVHEQSPLLFDLKTDPHERDDLAGRPEHQELCRMMAVELLAGLDVAALRERILRGQRERLVILEATPDQRSWDYRPRRDPLELYVRAKS